MTGQAVVLVLIAVGVWFTRAWFWPYGPCRRCGGNGRNAGSTRRRYGNCRRCDGAGRRMVRGARAVSRARKSALVRRKGSR
jgi:hypothetical protein